VRHPSEAARKAGEQARRIARNMIEEGHDPADLGRVIGYKTDWGLSQSLKQKCVIASKKRGMLSVIAAKNLTPDELHDLAVRVRGGAELNDRGDVVGPEPEEPEGTQDETATPSEVRWRDAREAFVLAREELRAATQGVPIALLNDRVRYWFQCVDDIIDGLGEG
jgi:hypothetical protein